MIEKIVKLVPGGGTLMFNGKIIEKPDEVTFVKAFVIEGSKFGLL